MTAPGRNAAGAAQRLGESSSAEDRRIFVRSVRSAGGCRVWGVGCGVCGERRRHGDVEERAWETWRSATSDGELDRAGGFTDGSCEMHPRVHADPERLVHPARGALD